MERATALINGTDHSALAAALAHIGELAAARRYETAARMRDHAAVAIEALWRGQRLRALAEVPELVAARSDGNGGWHFAVVRHGQLAGSGTAPRGVPPMPVVDAICSAAQVILPTPTPLGGALVEETALIARWLATPGVRIVRTDGDVDNGYATPIGAAGRYAQWAATARSARLAAAQQQDSELQAEPHPTREQLFGRARVDGLGGPRQTGLPRRHPLSVAG